MFFSGIPTGKMAMLRSGVLIKLTESFKKTLKIGRRLLGRERISGNKRGT